MCIRRGAATGGGRSGSDSGGAELGWEAMALMITGAGNTRGGAGVVGISCGVAGRVREKEEAT